MSSSSRPFVAALTSDSPLAPQPSGCRVYLYPHQRALLHRALLMEREEFDPGPGQVVPQTRSSSSSSSSSALSWQSALVRTRVGVLGDKVGAGKSYVVLAIADADADLVESRACCDRPSTYTRTYSEDRIRLTFVRQQTSNARLPRLTLVVIPHTLCRQWQQTIRDYTGGSDRFRVVSVSRQSHVTSLSDAGVLETTDILLVTNTFYNAVVAVLAGREVRRVVYDEADTLNIKSCAVVDADFCWLVTASHRNLVPDSLYGVCVRSSGYIRNLMCELACAPVSRYISRAIVARNASDFVDASTKLPPPVVRTVACRTPASIRVLEGMVDRHVIASLNAGDVESALQAVSPSHRGTEEGVISAILAKLSRDRHNLEENLAAVSRMRFEDESNREAERARLSARLDEITRRMDGIRERISRSDLCCICFHDAPIPNKSVTPCCSNVYCFACISKWVATAHTCPMCKMDMNISRLMVVLPSPAGVETSLDDPVSDDIVDDVPSPRNDKIRNLEAVLKLCGAATSPAAGSPAAAGKVLLFSCYENTFSDVEPLLQRLQVRYRYLKGNHHSISNIERDYRHGNLNVLLVNSTNYGSGLNCENTTDVVLMHKFDPTVEEQVIGRAQRPGRTQPLRVWYLLYENEISIVAR